MATVIDEATSTGTHDQWHDAQRHSRRVIYMSAALGVFLVAVLSVPAVYLATLTASGAARYVATAGWLAACIAPTVVVLARRSVNEQQKSDEVVEKLTDELLQAAETADREAAQRKRQARR